MSRIGDAFARARSEDRAALVVYLCAGDPSLDATVELVLAAADGGADVVELGVPFSDPTADGEPIQRAASRALAAGATLRGVLDVVERVRASSQVPILLFGYYNPFLVFGEEEISEAAARAGADGFLVVDLPPEESEPLRAPAVARGLDFVPLVAPTSNAWRRQLAAESATSFVYYVSLTGVTGAVAPDLAEAARAASAVAEETGCPVAVGFGIKTRDDVAAVAAHADGVVVGSAIVRVIEQAESQQAAVAAVRRLVSDLAAGTHRGEGVP